MKKRQLAGELRERQYRIRRNPVWMVDALTDQEIIDCYTMCCDCDYKVDKARVKEAIKIARNTEEFLALTSNTHERFFRDADEFHSCPKRALAIGRAFFTGQGLYQ